MPSHLIKPSDAAPLKNISVKVTAAIIIGITVGRKISGNINSLKRVLIAITDANVPRQANPSDVRTKTGINNKSNKSILNKITKIGKRNNSTTNKKTKHPNIFPKKMASRLIGAFKSPKIPPFSYSIMNVRFIPNTQANEIEIQKTPDATDVIIEDFGSIAMPNTTIVNNAKTITEIKKSLLRISKSTSFHTSAEITAKYLRIQRTVTKEI